MEAAAAAECAAAAAPFVRRVVGLGALPASTSSRLDSIQLGELELARQRAARATGRTKPAASDARKRARGSSAEEDGNSGDSDEDAANAGPTGDRRLRRLLRNRVAAQQARERKKHYVNTLEDQIKTLQVRLQHAEQALRSSEDQVATLRRIVLSMRGESSQPGPTAAAPAPAAPVVVLPPAASVAAPVSPRAGVGLHPRSSHAGTAAPQHPQAHPRAGLWPQAGAGIGLPAWDVQRPSVHSNMLAAV